ncbi:MAG: ribonuclease HI [Planctomycetota bacterium]|jgi:ribonuclease HI|nr:ribonuclease HI [Planctomycetota bacterium]
MQTVRIYSDGACSGNPGPGGWGAILQCDDPAREKEISGGEPHTTNNRMELLAVINAVELLKVKCRIDIFTDSQYVCEAFRKKWLANWQKNNWRTAAKTPVKNQDLWERLLAALAGHETAWHWIKGHNEHPENERADRLAVRARERLKSN